MRLVSRLGVPSPRVVDVAVVAVVAVPTFMDAWWNAPGTRQADVWTYLLVVVSVFSLLWRRRWPYAVTLVCGVALSALYVLGHHGELLNLPVMVGLYTIAVQGDRRATIVVGVVAAAWSGVLGFTSDDPIGARGGSPVLEMIWPLVPLALGEAARMRRELVALAAIDREREAQRRVETERTRMAGELHDVVAHTMAAVNVQMAAAVAAFDRDPELARASLLQARASSRAALQELGATVAVLRQDSGTMPAPRLDDVEGLLHTVRTGGLEVELTDDRNGVPMSGAVELTGYRIIQEAITNVLRHSDARHLRVAMRATTDELTIEVADDGTGAPDPSHQATQGYGLVGMRERVRSVDGSLTHGYLPGGGFQVMASIPLAPGPG